MFNSLLFRDVIAPQLLSANRTSHCSSNNDQDHDQCHYQERLDLHSEDYSRWSIVVCKAMSAHPVIGAMFPYYWIFVGGRVYVVVVFEAMCWRYFWSIVVLVERGHALWHGITLWKKRI